MIFFNVISISNTLESTHWVKQYAHQLLVRCDTFPMVVEHVVDVDGIETHDLHTPTQTTTTIKEVRFSS